ncbi:MAG: 2-C-methyl-D-erythritol 4-phosphate cytidylyltransferase [Candidatus Moanabacter tarae]|uniref:2-C-methyl-D-erythritol 4-phosphate cytidylyltransferase n=1 Tax=Candidatus Moanibacter tarae TaxID=2200854 RepID=A0A2Z4AI91_9BACT|nr:MAG: 2-C-methyl-D-erythritol 4-phosphate cytidylyltransferase [Candidatus Moanabacter tarae]|tara:strand:+ start:1675 stop:2457 length:783 start_codon:yes stop_codon:yes gene_type:complete
MSNAAILLAAGKGKRMEGKVEDKIFAPISGKSAFLHSLQAFRKSGIVEQITIVYRDDFQRQKIEEHILNANLHLSDITWSKGGRERQDSVYNGLQSTDHRIELVFIHDCARPMITSELIRALADKAARDGAVCLAHRATDTWKHVDPISDDGDSSCEISQEHRRSPTHIPNTIRCLLSDLNRNSLWAMETPQVFDRKLIIEAYELIRNRKLTATDDTTAFSYLNRPITLFENDSPNPKLTTIDDLEYIEFLVTKKPHNVE